MPKNLEQTPKSKEHLVKMLLADPSINEVAKFQSALLAQYAPKIYKYQAMTLTPLFLSDNMLDVNFLNSQYPAATFNLGPAAVTAMHIDS
ncbi:hypothetical protein C0993_001875, partial [Termitomyces sp. T159_Od127]